MSFSAIGQALTASVNGTCAANFDRMPESRQLEVIATVGAVALASGLFSSMATTLGKALTVTAFVAVGAFIYATHNYSTANLARDVLRDFANRAELGLRSL